MYIHVGINKNILKVILVHFSQEDRGRVQGKLFLGIGNNHRMQLALEAAHLTKTHIECVQH